MQNHLSKKIFFIALTLIDVLCPLFVVKAATGIEINSGSSMDSLSDILEWVINVFLVGILGLAAFIALVVGGFMYLLAGPDATKAERGKKTISYAITGLILAALSYSFSSIVINFLTDVFK